MPTRPRYLIDPDIDSVDDVLETARNAGWHLRSDPNCNTWAVSPDGRIVLAWLPEPNDYAPRVSGHRPWAVEWVIRVYKTPDHDKPDYELIFTIGTPAPVVDAALRSLIEPVDTTTGHQPQDGSQVKRRFVGDRNLGRTAGSRRRRMPLLWRCLRNQ
ncbi:DUF317 domain-containing protein [Actinomadura harenae]|nr:DUF317 domain-containing protein [Actinomadura harenae]